MVYGRSRGAARRRRGYIGTGEVRRGRGDMRPGAGADLGRPIDSRRSLSDYLVVFRTITKLADLLVNQFGQYPSKLASASLNPSKENSSVVLVPLADVASIVAD